MRVCLPGRIDRILETRCDTTHIIKRRRRGYAHTIHSARGVTFSANIFIFTEIIIMEGAALIRVVPVYTVHCAVYIGIYMYAA